MKILAKTLALTRMVKIEHSIFALPFAYMGAFIAAGGWPGWKSFLLLTLAMVAVRSFAMAFNRYADLKFDSQNSRTQTRPLVTGEITKKETIIFLIVTAIVFVGACAGMNKVCLILSVPALLFSAFYSYVKRFSHLCHFFLGGVLGLAPMAGWLCVQPGFPLPAVLLFLGVLFWVAGFDILYSCQDVEFDRSIGLHSVPARFGIATALAISTFCHVNTCVFFLLAGFSAWLGWPFYLTWCVISAILVLEHKVVSEDDMSRVNMAFFTMNGVVAVVFFVGVLFAI